MNMQELNIKNKSTWDFVSFKITKKENNYNIEQENQDNKSEEKNDIICVRNEEKKSEIANFGSALKILKKTSSYYKNSIMKIYKKKNIRCEYIKIHKNMNKYFYIYKYIQILTKENQILTFIKERLFYIVSIEKDKRHYICIKKVPYNSHYKHIYEFEKNFLSLENILKRNDIMLCDKNREDSKYKDHQILNSEEKNKVNSNVMQKENVQGKNSVINSLNEQVRKQQCYDKNCIHNNDNINKNENIINNNNNVGERKYLHCKEYYEKKKNLLSFYNYKIIDELSCDNDSDEDCIDKYNNILKKLKLDITSVLKNNTLDVILNNIKEIINEKIIKEGKIFLFNNLGIPFFFSTLKSKYLTYVNTKYVYFKEKKHFYFYFPKFLLINKKLKLLFKINENVCKYYSIRNYIHLKKNEKLFPNFHIMKFNLVCNIVSSFFFYSFILKKKKIRHKRFKCLNDVKEEANMCGKKNNACTKQNDACRKQNNACRKQNDACRKQNDACRKQSNVCGEQNNEDEDEIIYYELYLVKFYCDIILNKNNEMNIIINGLKHCTFLKNILSLDYFFYFMRNKELEKIWASSNFYEKKYLLQNIRRKNNYNNNNNNYNNNNNNNNYNNYNNYNHNNHRKNNIIYTNNLYGLNVSDLMNMKIYIKSVNIIFNFDQTSSSSNTNIMDNILQKINFNKIYLNFYTFQYLNNNTLLKKKRCIEFLDLFSSNKRTRKIIKKTKKRKFFFRRNSKDSNYLNLNNYTILDKDKLLSLYDLRKRKENFILDNLSIYNNINSNYYVDRQENCVMDTSYNNNNNNKRNDYNIYDPYIDKKRISKDSSLYYVYSDDSSEYLTNALMNTGISTSPIMNPNNGYNDIQSIYMYNDDHHHEHDDNNNNNNNMVNNYHPIYKRSHLLSKRNTNNTLYDIYKMLKNNTYSCHYYSYIFNGYMRNIKLYKYLFNLLRSRVLAVCINYSDFYKKCSILIDNMSVSKINLYDKKEFGYKYTLLTKYNDQDNFININFDLYKQRYMKYKHIYNTLNILHVCSHLKQFTRKKEKKKLLEKFDDPDLIRKKKNDNMQIMDSNNFIRNRENALLYNAYYYYKKEKIDNQHVWKDSKYNHISNNISSNNISNYKELDTDKKKPLKKNYKIDNLINFIENIKEKKLGVVLSNHNEQIKKKNTKKKKEIIKNLTIEIASLNLTLDYNYFLNILPLYYEHFRKKIHYYNLIDIMKCEEKKHLNIYNNIIKIIYYNYGNNEIIEKLNKMELYSFHKNILICTEMKQKNFLLYIYDLDIKKTKIYINVNYILKLFLTKNFLMNVSAITISNKKKKNISYILKKIKKIYFYNYISIFFYLLKNIDISSEHTSYTMLNFLNFLEYFLKNNLQQLSPLHNLYSFVVTLKYNYEHKLDNNTKAAINQENLQINKQRNSFLNAENNALLFFSKNYSHNIWKLEANYKKKKIKKKEKEKKEKEKEKEKEKDKYKDQQKKDKQNLAQVTKDRKRGLGLRRTGTEDTSQEGGHIYDDDEEEEEEDHSNNTYLKNFFTFNYSNIFPKLLSTSSYIHKKEEEDQVNAYSSEQNIMNKILSMHKKEKQITKNKNYNYNEQEIDGEQGVYYNLYNNKTKPFLRPTSEQHQIMDEPVSYVKRHTRHIRNDYEELLAYKTNNEMLLRENEKRKKKKKKKKKKKTQAPNVTHISFTHNLNITKGNI
ncbi:hypothetical protein PFAG_00746 [Plasmodium falciparum Santa Lucia]|uniref:Uncharacterized protein n=1 Tax=Plasmodium falciparum Santa Lucia TaxID=478859 RepID=W7FVG6_PLAFA|nr:hypothetical protein PFAG_00746 [Plasmodium falciparum Santa Lucia]